MLPKPLPEEEVARLIEEGPAPGPLELRDRAILEVLYGTGLRGLELVRLELEDVDLDECSLTEREGKGRKDRVVPFGERAREALLCYLKQGRPTTPARAVFVSRSARPLARAALKDIVSRAGKRAGLSRSAGPHRLRHSYATHLLRNGASVRAVQALLGHATLASTEVYLDVEVSDLMRMVEKSHPRGKQVE